jgi:hypothetical protein
MWGILLWHRFGRSGGRALQQIRQNSRINPMRQRAAIFSTLRAALVMTAATSLGCDS